MSSYRDDLRANRKAFVAGLSEKHGEGSPSLRQKYLRRAMAIQNETRGKLGELFGEISLTAAGLAHEEDIQRDRARFATPFGERRIDVWDSANRRAIEAKSGYACLSKFTRQQVLKDAYLLETGQVSHVSWRLMQDGSAPLKAFLALKGISVDVGWPEFENTSARIEAMMDASQSVSRTEFDR